MATALLKEKLYTPQEYLERERLAETRSEYINGRIYAMAGTSMPHAIISGNVYAALHNHLRGTSCTPMFNDMRVHIPDTGLYTYPDIVVVCGEPEMLDSRIDTLINPILIIEVLSDSTEAYDRGEKYAHYRRIPTLQEYVMISQKTPFIEQCLREDNHWTLNEVSGLDATLTLRSIDCAITLRDIYTKITFPEASTHKHPTKTFTAIQRNETNETE